MWNRGEEEEEEEEDLWEGLQSKRRARLQAATAPAVAVVIVVVASLIVQGTAAPEFEKYAQSGLDLVPDLLAILLLHLRKVKIQLSKLKVVDEEAAAPCCG